MYEEVAEMLDKAQETVLQLWATNKYLARQANFWNEDDEVSMFVFTSNVSREETLAELRDAAAKGNFWRVHFFSESGVITPDGQTMEVLLLEVGDADSQLYGVRLFSVEHPPQILAQNAEPLESSPLAGMLKNV